MFSFSRLALNSARRADTVQSTRRRVLARALTSRCATPCRRMGSVVVSEGWLCSLVAWRHCCFFATDGTGVVGVLRGSSGHFFALVDNLCLFMQAQTVYTVQIQRPCEYIHNVRSYHRHHWHFLAVHLSTCFDVGGPRGSDDFCW